MGKILRLTLEEVFFHIFLWFEHLIPYILIFEALIESSVQHKYQFLLLPSLRRTCYNPDRRSIPIDRQRTYKYEELTTLSQVMLTEVIFTFFLRPDLSWT